MHYSGKYNKLDNTKFQRLTGLSKTQFDILLRQLTEYKDKNWNRRGRQDSKLTLTDKLLLTLRYLRDYPTFLSLGNEFDISESYSYKIFTKVSLSLVKMLSLPNIDNLSLETIIIDVTEQETEKPKKTNN